MKDWWLEEFLDCVRRGDLARAALAVARVEFPALEPALYVERLETMGDEVRRRLETLGGEVPAPGPGIRAAVLNEYLFRERSFAGNRANYGDPRNSCLNEVLDRALGIPITLGLVYMEVARRAGVRVEGINFPGHFLVSCSGDPLEGGGRRLILDPFDRGAVLSEADCRRLLADRLGEAASFDPSMLTASGPQEILIRLLVNLKRAFVAIHSYRQARAVTEYLLAVDPSAFHELRDRGLLAFQMNDFSAALRDLERYLRLVQATDLPGSTRDDEDREQIWEYVKALRKRVASFN